MIVKRSPLTSVRGGWLGGFVIGDADKHTYRLFIEAPMTLDDTHQMLLDAIYRGDFVDRTDVILPIVYDDVL